MECVRCKTGDALPAQGDLCAPCTVSTRLEVAAGLRRLGDHLASWAAFDDWLRLNWREQAIV